MGAFEGGGEIDLIAYKVVEKGTRWGSNWMMFKDVLTDPEALPSSCEKGLKFQKEHPEFFPRYFKNTIVKAAPKSRGILCFETKQHAERFITYSDLKHRAIIVKVRGIGQARQIVSVIPNCGSFPWHLTLTTKMKLGFYMMRAPKGTIAFNAVEVLE